MRITTVKHAQKKLSCGSCGDAIKPSRNEKQRVLNKRTGKTAWKTVRILGDGYRWIKPMRGGKRVRCMKHDCRFRTSDMVQGKMSGVYGAQESAEDTIAGWTGEDGSTDDLKSALEEMAEIVREVASEYGESADNMEQAFTGGSSQIDEIREKQEALDGWADEIEQAASEFEDWDGPEAGEGTEDDAPGEVGAEKNSSGETREDWVEAQREKANEAIGECPV